MMTKILMTSAITLAMAALATTPAAAHDIAEIKPAGKCDAITSTQWNQVRKGMSLEAIEHITGCRASHSSTNNFKIGKIDNYFFKTGGRALAEIQVKNGKLWQKYGYHSGL